MRARLEQLHIALDTANTHSERAENAVINFHANRDGYNEQAGIRHDARRALGSLPKYDGKTAFRAFYMSYINWSTINQIGEVVKSDGSGQIDLQCQKMTLLACMMGVAVELCQRIGPESENWNNYTTFKDFENAVRQIFCP